jgi:hypothetical protein
MPATAALESTMISHIPVWVFFLLFGLLALGYRLSRTRVVRPGSVALIAFAMLAYSLYGVISAFGVDALPLAAWAVGIAAAIVLGSQAIGSRGLSREGERVRVAGSWWPMLLLMAIFAVKFALGMARGVGSPLVEAAWCVVAASTVSGLISGTFAAKALAVHRFADAAHAA